MNATSAQIDVVGRLADRAAIEDVLHRYSRGIDRRDWGLVQSAYHDDAVENHGTYLGSVDGFVEWLQARHEVVAYSLHAVSNVTIDHFADGRAHVESYCIAYQVLVPPHPQVASGHAAARLFAPVRYVDIFEQRDGDWRIAQRTVVYGDMALEQLDALPTMPPGVVVETRDQSDFSYVRPT